MRTSSPTRHPVAAAFPLQTGSAPAGRPSVWDLNAAILLVEDDAGDALLVEEMLADGELDSALTWCKNLTEALTFLRGHRTPVCVLLDLHLPDVNGLSAVNRILETTPDAAIVVLTGLAEAEAGLDAVATGAQDYLVKGRIDPQALSRAVRYALQRKQVERAAAALRATQLMAQENARLERGLLPVPLLNDDGFEAVATYEPGRAHGLLSGDFYDVVQRPDGTVHAVIGDVSGHGAAEAALGVCLRVAWRTAVLCDTGQLEQLALLEEILVAERSDPHVFATVTSLVFPPGGDHVRIVRAGHPGLLVRNGTDIDWVEPEGGIALGLLPGHGQWISTEHALAPGSGLVLFTDGLFEGRTGPDTRLGEEGLLAMARDRSRLPARPFVDALVAGATEGAAPYGGLADDVAVLHLAWKRNTS
ncbi:MULTISPECIES: PP2C family protein-serine/threonine phosphatase [unclassified Streptomyces]|uniref:PP2C family protein-serine/threonine phosphatase n=1 Tax=unclassified Streptomyces TaxID=2593676 RepID=UPI002252FD62|nr:MULTISPECIES: SpoIIE family protein phosphatase [unclassified Streptomyces]MCX5144612.1 SpoIIE family protein phosphatase [Streptomyces sp. NBC_00338]WRZ68975.1 SpoIIE family protein phosphatase [Streptomyces sp. NBC_01257]WSU62924.1 SpoIIE family protein phosphatase [Streptomyces sp. NBC_01104]